MNYLQDLGINAVYFNPLNDAPSLHKYDARNYHHIDVTFGDDRDGDLALMKKEDPSKPESWVWTSADKKFVELISQFHKAGIKVVLDFSWNHTGTQFWAFQDIIKMELHPGLPVGMKSKHLIMLRHLKMNGTMMAGWV